MSLRGKLLRWLVIPLMLVNLAGATAIYWLAWLPAQAALDQSLAGRATTDSAGRTGFAGRPF